MPSRPVQVKKVRPYPIPCQISFSARTVQGGIAKLTQVGFLLQTDVLMQVGERGVARFQLPASFHVLNVNVIVVRTWDSMASGLSSAGVSGQHTAEIHFQALDVMDSTALTNFLKATGQLRAS